MEWFAPALKGVRRLVVPSLLALLSPSAFAAPQPVTWLPTNGVSQTGAVLSRAPGSGFSETTVGAMAITAGVGHLEFGTAENDRAKAAGLGPTGLERGVEAIDFGFLLRADGTAAVIEKGVPVQSLGGTSPLTSSALGSKARPWFSESTGRWCVRPPSPWSTRCSSKPRWEMKAQPWLGPSWTEALARR